MDYDRICWIQSKNIFKVDDDKKAKEHEKAKGTKKCVIKRSLMFEDYTDFLFNDKIILKS